MSNHGTSTTSSLRPRNKRLISIEDGDGLAQHPIDLKSGPKSAPIAEAEPSSSTYASTSGSLLGLPSYSIEAGSGRSQPSRSQSGTTGKTRKWGLAVPTPTSASFLFSPKYWGDSLSSLQDVATTLIGTDIRDAPKSATLPRGKHTRQASRFGGPIEDEWGPTINIENTIATGSQEDRLAQIQASKRKALLTANGYDSRDSRGKFKRKLSIDESTHVPEQSEDALVYVHPVQPSDSVTGLAIRYGCSEAVVRKANRLWANDSMQLRRLAYIPVDACTVRGQKIDESLMGSSLENEWGSKEVPLTPNSQTDWSIPTTPKIPNNQLPVSPSLSATTSSRDISPPHIHESWVQISGFPTSTEIARLPRRTLGFFPPARRKSNSYHDDTPSGDEANILWADNPTEDESTRSFSLALNSPSSMASPRPRALTNLKSPNTIASVLHGPGGVGTLGYEARAPGPAHDKLNIFFSTHFPTVAISPGSYPNMTHGFDSLHSGVSTPTGSVSGRGLEQIGGKVETWVRKTAKGIRDLGGSTTGSNGSRRGSISQLVGGKVQGDGDLIEMMSGMDLLGGNEAQGDDKGKARAPDPDIGVGSGRANDGEDLLRERFPVGGRVFESVRK